ncbi:outer membrane protein assembly factor BamE domain-containing protein [Daejeonella lutea]|nr:outer membrane protein assembly factor BamE [Daejeonella lutea]
MKKYLIIFMSFIILGSCTQKQQEFSSVKKGMTKEEVVKLVGEPTTKRDILVAEVWKYDLADRSVVFRNGNVYDIITSTEARVDSIEASLKNAGKGLKEKLEKTGDTIDSASQRLKDKIDGDSVKKK